MGKWTWIFRYLKHIKWSFGVSLVLGILSMLGILGIIAIQKLIIDDILLARNYSLFWPVMVWLVITIITYLMAYAFSFILVRKNIVNLQIEISKELINFHLTRPFSSFSKERIGKMYTYFTQEVQDTSTFLAYQMLFGIVSIVQSIVLIAIIGFANLPILCGLICCTFLYIWIGKYYLPKKKAIQKEMQSLQGDINVLIEEGISATREVVAFHRIDWELNRLKKLFHTYLAKVTSEGKLTNKELFSSEPIKWFVHLSVLVFSGYLVINGKLSIGMLVVLYQFSSKLIDSVQTTYNFITSSTNALASAERLEHLLNETPVTNGSYLLAGPIQKIQLKQITFRYSEDTQEILSDFSMDIPMSKKKIAFVGYSGSGKSTIIQLLTRLYDPQQGEILINEKDLRDIDRSSWLGKIAIVFQEPYFFPDTVRNNLLFHNDSISEELLILACKTADIYETIQMLPNGFETMVGERGVQFSGGQRQRLALVRALLRSPEILILDEATSSLDFDTERTVFYNLDKDYPDITKIIIAHRLSTIENADHIFVLDGGMVVEQGTHGDLMVQDTLYRSLAEQTNKMDEVKRLERGNDNGSTGEPEEPFSIRPMTQ